MTSLHNAPTAIAFSASRSVKNATKLITIIALSSALAACATPDTRQFQTDPSQPQSAEAIRTIYADRTIITHSSHGTQVEYHGTSGISHLWYPGNARGVPAKWEARLDTVGHDICWKYPTRSYNPLTRQSGGSWECTSDRFYFPSVAQIIKGDPFNLNSGQVPFQLGRGKFLAADLAEASHIPFGELIVIYPKP